jgi:transcriptional regulator with XRE-family HTH domain
MKTTDTPLRAARLKLGLTLEALAAAARTDSGTVSRIERGKPCSPDMAERLCIALGGSLTEIEVLYPHRAVAHGTKSTDTSLPTPDGTAPSTPEAGTIHAASGATPTTPVRQPLQLGPNPPTRIRIEGHVYKLERKA